jgi:hypothetical protein
MFIVAHDAGSYCRENPRTEQQPSFSDDKQNDLFANCWLLSHCTGESTVSALLELVVNTYRLIFRRTLI